jgi:3-oxoadipate enol-lactonase
MTFDALKNCAFARQVETSRISLFVACSAGKSSSMPRLLFLGGSNTDFSIKAPVFSSKLIEHFNVLSYEPRGLGRSASPAGDWTMKDYALDAIALLDAFGWDEAFVVGESFGGMTSLEVAMRFPARVRKLCITAAASGGGGGSSYPIHKFLDLPPREKAIAALSVMNGDFKSLIDEKPEVAEGQIAARIATDAAFLESCDNVSGYPRLLAARAGHNAYDRLHRITVPTLVFSGIMDQQAPVACGIAMAERIPNAELFTFDGGHGFTFADPRPAEAILTQWT